MASRRSASTSTRRRLRPPTEDRAYWKLRASALGLRDDDVVLGRHRLGEGRPERRALLSAARDTDDAVVHLHKSTHDGETQPATRHRRITDRSRSPIALEELLLVLGGDALAQVVN